MLLKLIRKIKDKIYEKRLIEYYEEYFDDDRDLYAFIDEYSNYVE